MSLLEVIKQDKEANGFSLINAGSFFCTVGFHEKFGAPEIIVSGSETLAKMIAVETRKFLQNGGTIEHGNIFYMKEVDRLISILEISTEHVFSLVPLLSELYDSEPRFTQYIYSDRDGIFPWDVGIRALINRRKQFVLQEVPWL